MIPTHKIIAGDCIAGMKTLPDGCVQTCITSPPYYGLRNYDGGTEEIGCEESPESYVKKMVEVFREVRRILRDDGTVWLNLGDSYASNGCYINAFLDKDHNKGKKSLHTKNADRYEDRKGCRGGEYNIKGKDLIGIPWRVAFALQADGWYLRQDIIWCLSGGTWVYARTQKGDRPITVSELARMKPNTVQLWNGTKWTRVLGTSKSKRRGDELEIVLRSGERISCTPTHQFPTHRGLVTVSEIKLGDILDHCCLPEPTITKDCALDEDAAWLAGLYLAEGSRSGDTIQIAGHAKETARWVRLQAVAKKFGGSATHTVSGNCMNIRLYGKVLNAIIDELVGGYIAKNKGLATVVWQYSNSFLRSILDGYLSGDGCWDANNKRWRLGFTRNYNLERDLRTLAARLGFKMTLKLSTASMGDRIFPSFRGEIRFEESNHHNIKDQNEVVEIHKARCRHLYDIGVEDDPHVFALASGILSHNSKPNPMPESVTDRSTKAHEYIFLLSKQPKYYYDHVAIKEVATGYDGRKDTLLKGSPKYKDFKVPGQSTQSFAATPHERWIFVNGVPVRNKRSVWTVNTKPFKGAHFATYPKDLILPCVLAGTSEKGCCSKCGSPYEREIETTRTFESGSGKSGNSPIGKNGKNLQGGGETKDIRRGPVCCNNTLGWNASCSCENAEIVPCTVFDPFTGSGTTAVVALENGRSYIGTELNQEYIKIAEARIRDDIPATLQEFIG